MFAGSAILPFATLLLSATTNYLVEVNAHPLPVQRSHALLARHISSAHVQLLAARKEPPAGWAEGYLEDYKEYHLRYTALDCKNPNNTSSASKRDASFFDRCCHPLLATENVQDNRDADCKPTQAQLDKAQKEIDAGTEDSDNEDDGECSDPAPSQAPPAAAAASPSPSPEPKPEPKPSPSPSPSPAPSPSPSPKAEVQAKAAAPPKQDNNNNKPKDDDPPSDSDDDGGDFLFGQATFFDQNGNPGACGKVHAETDKVIAVEADIFKNGAVCGKKVKITTEDGSKSVDVTIADLCPTCEPGTHGSNSIDLSHGAFDALADESAGVVQVKWQILP